MEVYIKNGIMHSMSTVAVGAYIRTLREARRLTRDAVAELVNTSVSQLVRIEAGEQDTRSTLLARIIAAVGGSASHVQKLIVDGNATEEDGKRLAHTAIKTLEDVGALPEDFSTPEDVSQFIIFLREQLSDLPPEDRRRLEDTVRGVLLGYSLPKSGKNEKPQ
jgi:transcriptional regulator with XRE-family HTH domain